MYSGLYAPPPSPRTISSTSIRHSETVLTKARAGTDLSEPWLEAKKRDGIVQVRRAGEVTRNSSQAGRIDTHEQRFQ